MFHFFRRDLVRRTRSLAAESIFGRWMPVWVAASSRCPPCVTFRGVLAFYVVICSPFPSIMKLRLYDRKTVFSGAGQIQAER